VRVIRVGQKARWVVVLQFAHAVAPMSQTVELKLDQGLCHSARTTHDGAIVPNDDVAIAPFVTACVLGPRRSSQEVVELRKRSTPDRRTRRVLLHLSYSCAPPILTAALVTHDPERTLAALSKEASIR